MRKQLGYILIQLLSVIVVLFIGGLLFLLIAKVPLADFAKYEVQLFAHAYSDSRYYFPTVYWLNAAIILGLLAGGIWLVIVKAVLPIVKWLAKHAKGNMAVAGPVVLVLFMAVLVAAGLQVKEWHYSYLSYYAGSRYPGNDFKNPNPIVSLRTMADERGMTYMAPDSFPITTDTTRFSVNREGFPSLFNFDTEVIDSLVNSGTVKKRKVLFLGDSFLEGVGSSTHDKAFIEILRRNNPDILVCNTGLGGMDPVQYRLVAEKYAPVIKPDEICVMFCGWNDIIWLDRKPMPYLPIYSEVKSVGFINNYIPQGIACDSTLALPTPEAYKLYRSRFSLMDRTDFWARLCRQTNVTTQLYFHINPIVNYKFWYPSDSLATYRNLKRVKEMADSVGAAFKIVFVPTPDMSNYSYKDYTARYSWAFRELWPYVICPPANTIKQRDCLNSIDFHFNDMGQMNFAVFLQKVFDKTKQE